MTSNNSFRPCQFCGVDDNVELCSDSTWHEVVCLGCDIEGPGGFTAEEAIKRWNVRDKLISKTEKTE